MYKALSSIPQNNKNYCNRIKTYNKGERINSSPSKQKAREFLSPG
jgi:hypothetical protein